MYKFFKKILFVLFPVLDAINGNAKVQQSIDKLRELSRLDSHNNSYYMRSYQQLSINNALFFLNSTYDKRKSLEDKAKINIFGVTIAMSLIISIYKIFIDIVSFQMWAKILLFILSTYGISLMIMGGVLSLKLLNDKIMQFELSPEDTSLPNEEKLDLIALATELNVKLNLERNNYLSSSYQSIKNALISLFLFFLFIVISVQFVSTNLQPNRQDIDKISQQVTQITNEQQQIKEEIIKLRMLQIRKARSASD